MNYADYVTRLLGPEHKRAPIEEQLLILGFELAGDPLEGEHEKRIQLRQKIIQLHSLLMQSDLDVREQLIADANAEKKRNEEKEHTAREVKLWRDRIRGKMRPWGESRTQIVKFSGEFNESQVRKHIALIDDMQVVFVNYVPMHEVMNRTPYPGQSPVPFRPNPGHGYGVPNYGYPGWRPMPRFDGFYQPPRGMVPQPQATFVAGELTLMIVK